MMGLDDRILEHPKFIRLVCECGSDGLFLWLALRAHCGQHLTDGRVPKDIVPELRGPKSKRVRENCLAAMLRVRLLHDLGDEWEMHDYLDWADSREKVLEKRKKWRERQGLSRASKRDSTMDSSEESRRDTLETLQGLSEESRRSSSSASSSASSERLSNLPTPSQDLSGHPAREAPQPGGGKVRCPIDLTLTEDQLGALEMNQGCKRQDALRLCQHFAGKWQGDEIMAIETWRRRLWTAVGTAWGNQGERLRLLPPPGAAEHAERQSEERRRPETRTARKRVPSDLKPTEMAKLAEQALASIGGKP